MDQTQASITATAEAIETAFGGRWGVWLSDTDRWWAARRDSLSAAELGVGRVPFLRAETPDELTERIGEQETLCAPAPAERSVADTCQPHVANRESGMRVEPGTAVNPSAVVSRSDSVLKYSRVFPGRTDQVREVRATLGHALASCPMAADAVLIASELGANAVLHSRSRDHGGMFKVRAEVHHGDYLWLEVEDGGGPWVEQPRTDGRGHGLKITAALSSEWGVEGDEQARVVWVRFDWPGPVTGAA